MGVEKKVASGLIVIVQRKILLFQEGDEGLLRIPAGAPRPKENMARNAERQLFEWTGYRGHTKRELGLYKVEQGGTEWILHQYLGQLEEKRRTIGFKHNGNNVRWVPIEELKEGLYKVAPNIEYLLERGEIK